MMRNSAVGVLSVEDIGIGSGTLLAYCFCVYASIKYLENLLLTFLLLSATGSVNKIKKRGNIDRYSSARQMLKKECVNGIMHYAFLSKTGSAHTYFRTMIRFRFTFSHTSMIMLPILLAIEVITETTKEKVPFAAFALAENAERAFAVQNN